MSDHGTQSDKKRVWILGAGFSRSLGGPLMADLLSLAARRRILATYSTYFNRDDVDQIFWIFHYGCRFPEGRLDPQIDEYGETAWSDAEQFLSMLDSAKSDKVTRTVISGVIEALQGLASRVSQHRPSITPRLNAFRKPPVTSIDELAKLAKRIVAASCTVFLSDLNDDSTLAKELWMPYRDWFSRLDHNDSIVTFNYDTVVELLKSEVGQIVKKARVIGVSANADHDEVDARKARLPCLYKLHGSVNWAVHGTAIKEYPLNADTLNSSIDLAIATPGDSKMEMSGGLLKTLWQKATTQIELASEVFILGFRFPQSDAFPRDRLLHAMRNNKMGDFRVNVILGPVENPDKKRVLTLLDWTTGHSPIQNVRGKTGVCLVDHTLWAEDFLSVWAGAK
jgi:hypothetical protein